MAGLEVISIGPGPHDEGLVQRETNGRAYCPCCTFLIEPDGDYEPDVAACGVCRRIVHKRCLDDDVDPPICDSCRVTAYEESRTLPRGRRTL